MTIDIFDFWSHIKPCERVHPADREVFDRVGRNGHGLDLRCLPACFVGPLRTAPVVLLFLSPGFVEEDLKDARSEKGRTKYVERRTGRQAVLPEWTGYKWFASRIKAFDLDVSEACKKIAVLNIGAYHSKFFKDYPLLAALPSSRVSLDWAQKVLFPAALRGERVVVCLRAAHFWGLEAGKCHGRSLFAPQVTRAGHIKKKSKSEKKMRDEIIHAVRKILQS